MRFGLGPGNSDGEAIALEHDMTIAKATAAQLARPQQGVEPYEGSTPVTTVNEGGNVDMVEKVVDVAQGQGVAPLGLIDGTAQGMKSPDYFLKQDRSR